MTRPSAKAWQPRTLTVPGGVLSATVTSLAPLMVSVPALAAAPAAFSVGAIAEGLWSSEATGTASGHTHAMGTALAVGDQVLVAALDGSTLRVAILARAVPQ